MTALTQHSSKHRIVQRNLYCTYCAAPLAQLKGGEQEHVIGRRFVPKGSLSGQWNLIVQSCPQCNDYKADLEDDISAITLQPDAWGRFPNEDAQVRAEAIRKARTRNRRTQRRVSEPTPPLVIKSNFGPAEFTFTLRSPAQADESRLLELARLQLVAFFSMLTYNEEARRGGFWPGEYAPVIAVRRADWGNPRIQWINQISADWDYRLHAIGANEFYKIWIRRREDGPAVWAWAIEWNKNFRLAGFFGDTGALQQLFGDMPDLPMTSVADGPDCGLSFRTEIALEPCDDSLFATPQMQQPPIKLS